MGDGPERREGEGNSEQAALLKRPNFIIILLFL